MSKKKIITCSLLILLAILSISGVYYFKTNKKTINNKNISKSNLAIMIKKNGEDSYTESLSNDIPIGNYILNYKKSICENNGKIVKYNNLNGSISFSFLGSDKCTLYFDEGISLASICNNYDDLLSCYDNNKEEILKLDSISGPYNGLIRYYGKEVNNYVNLDGKLFRIIGITDGSRANTNLGLNRGQLKLIKPEVIDTSTWDNTFSDDVLNDNNIIPSSYINKISSQKYLDEDMDNSGYAPGVTKNMKLGLMYDTDIYYSIKDGLNSCYSNGSCSDSWLNIGINEWTGSRAGWDGFVWYILYFNGSNVIDVEETTKYSRRIVFYLNPSIKIIGGKGTIDEPYELSDSGKTYELQIEPIPPKIISVKANLDSTITVSASDENGLSSYCINQNSNDTTDCTWINNTLTNWNTVAVSTSGDYYVHVKNVDSLISHSTKITVTLYTETLYAKAKNSAGLSTDVKYGMYRFIGDYKEDATSYAGIIDNYVCLGAYDKSTCMSDPDKYMFRIIGLVKNDDTGTQHKEGEIKVLKDTSVGKYKWDGGTTYNEGLVNQTNWNQTNTWYGKVVVGTSPCDESTIDNKCSITWSQSLLRCDSSGTLYSLNCSTNSYWKSINFIDKVVSSRWHNPKALIWSTAEEYSSSNVRNGDYFGLIYYNDYKVGGEWLKYSGYTLFNTGIEFITGSYRFSVKSIFPADDYYAWIIGNKWDTYGLGDVKPTFYLKETVLYKSGSGTYNDPFIIKE